MKNLSVTCYNLIIEGTFHCSADCTNDLIIKTNNTITGYITCKRAIIENKSNATFQHPLQAEDVIIEGTLNANINCSGSITLRKKAKLIGNMTAATIHIEEGAKHEGALSLNT